MFCTNWMFFQYLLIWLLSLSFLFLYWINCFILNVPECDIMIWHWKVLNRVLNYPVCTHVHLIGNSEIELKSESFTDFTPLLISDFTRGHHSVNWVQNWGKHNLWLLCCVLQHSSQTGFQHSLFLLSSMLKFRLCLMRPKITLSLMPIGARVWGVMRAIPRL